MNLRLSKSSERFGWAELVTEWTRHLQATRKASTAKSYSERMRLFLAWIETQGIDLDGFRPSHLDTYLLYRRDNGAGPTTCVYDAKLVRLMLEYAWKEQHLTKRVLRDYKIRRVPPKKQYCPTVAEMQAFLTGVDARWDIAKNPPIRNVNPKERRFLRARDMAIFCGLIDTACRINELLTLNLDDLDYERMQFHLDDADSKTPRTVPFTQKWLDTLHIWRKERPAQAESKRLFVSAYGDELSVVQLSKTFRLYRDFAGLPKTVHLHTLRHYALTSLAENDLLAAKDIAGHKDIRTTMIYAHSREERAASIQQKADTLGPLLINKRSEAAKKARRKLI